jgi:hypothetical protein
MNIKNMLEVPYSKNKTHIETLYVKVANNVTSKDYTLTNIKNILEVPYSKNKTHLETLYVKLKLPLKFALTIPPQIHPFLDCAM